MFDASFVRHNFSNQLIIEAYLLEMPDIKRYNKIRKSHLKKWYIVYDNSYFKTKLVYTGTVCKFNTEQRFIVD